MCQELVFSGSDVSYSGPRGNREAEGLTGLRPRANSLGYPLFPHDSLMCPKSEEVWNILLLMRHTQDENNVKLSNIETGYYLKYYHMRNFLASLISDRITSFVALFAGFLVIATNIL